MDEENGNDGEPGTSGNPYISGSLCAAYREHIETKIDSMEEKILGSIKLTSAIIAVIMTVVQLGLYFLGGL